MEDLELIGQRDDSDASVFFKRDYQRILRYILSMVKNVSEAEDLAQETFLRAYSHRDSLRNENAQTAWLYRIATHVCLDRLRQFSRWTLMESETDLDQVDIPEPDAPSLQLAIEQDEMAECVQHYINLLSDSYRAVILLHDIHELTTPEISLILGESLANIKIRLHRSRLKLITALKTGCAFSHDERGVLTCESKP